MTRRTPAGRQQRSSHKQKKTHGCTGPHRAVLTAEEAEKDMCAYVISPKGERAPYKTIKNRK